MCTSGYLWSLTDICGIALKALRLNAYIVCEL
jgi:hypothetical protein